MMQQATIQVKYINEPRNPKGPATVKDADGIYWKFWTNKIPMNSFKEGMTYSVGYETEKSEKYGESRTITAVSLPDAAGPLTQQAKNGGTAMPTQSAIVSASSPTYTKDEMIFVCGALNHMLGNSMVDPTKVTAIQGIATVNMWREVWAATFGQIPF